MQNKEKRHTGGGGRKAGCRPKAYRKLKLVIWNYIKELIIQHGRFKSDYVFGRLNISWKSLYRFIEAPLRSRFRYRMVSSARGLYPDFIPPLSFSQPADFPKHHTVLLCS